MLSKATVTDSSPSRKARYRNVKQSALVHTGPRHRLPAPSGPPQRNTEDWGQGAHGAMPPSMHQGGTPRAAWPALPGVTAQQTARRRPRAALPGESPALGPGAGRRPAHTAPARRTHNATHPRTRISPVVHPPRRKRRARARIRDTQLRVRTVCFQIPEALPGCCPVRSNRKYHLVCRTRQAFEIVSD